MSHWCRRRIRSVCYSLDSYFYRHTVMTCSVIRTHS